MKKKKKRPPENGTNIKAPRVFEDGELVLFIQRIHGLSMCFGRGVIKRTAELPTGYSAVQGKRLQYIIKGSRLFIHDGSLTKDKGAYSTWLGSTKMVIVPRTAKSEKWMEERVETWKAFLGQYNDIIKDMRLT